MTFPTDVQIGLRDAWWIVSCLFGAGMLKSFGEEMGKTLKRKLWDSRKGDYVDKNGNRSYRSERELLSKLVALRETEAQEREAVRVRHEQHENVTLDTNHVVRDCESSIRTIPTLNESVAALNANVKKIRQTLDGEI